MIDKELAEYIVKEHKTLKELRDIRQEQELLALSKMFNYQEE